MKAKKTKQGRIEMLKGYFSRFKSGSYYKSSESAIEEISSLYGFKYDHRQSLERDLATLRQQGFIKVDTEIIPTAKITNGTAVSGLVKKRTICFDVVDDIISRSFCKERFIYPGYVTWADEQKLTSGKWIQGTGIDQGILIANPNYSA